jgi:hypothetical protein
LGVLEAGLGVPGGAAGEEFSGIIGSDTRRNKRGGVETNEKAGTLNFLSLDLLVNKERGHMQHKYERW